MKLTSYRSLLFRIADCQESWQSFSVAMDRPPSAEHHLEILRAEAILAAMDAYEELAELAEQTPVTVIQTQLRGAYQKAIGISPEHRRELRVALEGVRDGGDQTVANLMDLIRRRYQANGFVSGDDSVA